MCADVSTLGGVSIQLASLESFVLQKLVEELNLRLVC